MNNIPKFIFNTYLGWKEPIYLVHLLTFRCNARCRHCFIDFKNPDTFKGELTLPEIQKMTKTMGSSMINVNFSGGEPFLRPDIFEVAKAYFENAKVQSVYINTNGTFTESVRKFLDKFIKNKIKGKIIISISIDDFPNKHNENRQVKDLFKKAMETYMAVKTYENKNILANIALTVTPFNSHEVIDVYKFLKSKYKVDAFTVTLMREEGVVKKIPKILKTKMLVSYIKLTSLISCDLQTKNVKGFSGSVQGRIMNSKNLITYKVMKRYAKKQEYISHCPAAALFGVIYPNGDVYPCEILPQFNLGNIRNYKFNFLKLWQGKTAKKAKKFIIDTHCNCSYECAWSTNIVSNITYIPQLFGNFVKSFL